MLIIYIINCLLTFVYLIKYNMDLIKYKARSAIIGAMIGDALGTTMEFSTGTDARQIIELYSNFDDGLVGKGPFNVSPGQFTDDSEMGLAIMSVMIKFGKYDQEKVAEAYYQWYKSHPIDIGTTTLAAVRQATATKMINIGKTKNAYSLSNGFLMRLPGLVALHYNKTSLELIQSVTQDVALTHGHPDACAIAVVYASMLFKAIHGASANEVYEFGKYMANLNEFNGMYCPLVSAIYSAIESESNAFSYNGRVCCIDLIDSENIGFCAYAIWLLLLCLKGHTNYRSAILEIASYAGDSDTNSCIVGAVMGALYPNTIPKKWIDSVMKFSNQNRFRSYPIANPAIWSKWLP